MTTISTVQEGTERFLLLNVMQQNAKRQSADSNQLLREIYPLKVVKLVLLAPALPKDILVPRVNSDHAASIGGNGKLAKSIQ